MLKKAIPLIIPLALGCNQEKCIDPNQTEVKAKVLVDGETRIISSGDELKIGDEFKKIKIEPEGIMIVEGHKILPGESYSPKEGHSLFFSDYEIDYIGYSQRAHVIFTDYTEGYRYSEILADNYELKIPYTKNTWTIHSEIYNWKSKGKTVKITIEYDNLEKILELEENEHVPITIDKHKFIIRVTNISEDKYPRADGKSCSELEAKVTIDEQEYIIPERTALPHNNLTVSAELLYPKEGGIIEYYRYRVYLDEGTSKTVQTHYIKLEEIIEK